LFQSFRRSESEAEKKAIAEELLASLDAHAKAEEEIFYPAVRESTGDELLMDMAREEHHAAKMFVMELARMEPGDPRYEAKLFVLQQDVDHHMLEEETDILPRAEQLGAEWLEMIGTQMAERWPEFRAEAESMVQGGFMANAKGLFEQAREAMGRG
jgi:hemerythrin superfamily protein